MKPLIRIANLFIYTSKQVGQINEKHRKIKELFNEVDCIYSRGINFNNETGEYELSRQSFEELDDILSKWENMEND